MAVCCSSVKRSGRFHTQGNVVIPFAANLGHRLLVRRPLVQFARSKFVELQWPFPATGWHRFPVAGVLILDGKS